MNPFTESTVARPLSESAKAKGDPSGAQPQPAHGALPPAAPQLPPSSIRPGIVALLRSKAFLPALRRLRRGGAVNGAVRTCRGRAGAWLLLVGLSLAPGLAAAVDVNAATLEQLRSVRGIGPKTAQTIIDERTRGGKYESFDDLSERVKGIGAKKAAALQASGLTLGPGAGQGQSPAAISKASPAPAAPARSGGK